MKATIGAILIGLTGASVTLAQSPAFSRLTSNSPSFYAPPPAMPGLPSFVQNQQVGAQLMGSGIPMPQVPMIPMPNVVVADDGKQPAAPPMDPNQPYLTEPYNPPDYESLIPMEDYGGGGRSGVHLWMNADYLFWWLNKGPQPNPLLSTGPATDDFPGALDQPNTRILSGGSGQGFNAYSGVRLSLGMWAGSDSRYGFEVGGFLTEQKSNQFRASGDANGQPFLARPFINARTGNENVYFVSQNFADPTRSAFMTGGIDISSNSRLWGWEVNSLYNAYRGPVVAINLIGGFASFGLREQLNVSESLRNLVPGGGVSFNGLPTDPTQTVLTFDRFETQNTFYGGQLGTRLHFQRNRLGIDVTAKAAIGVMQQQAEIYGATVLQNPTGPIGGALPGGVLASGPNIGHFFQNQFAVIPQGNFDLSYELIENLVVKVGYSFMYVNNVLRPGNQIDRTVNPGFVPSDPEYGTPGGPARPYFPNRTSTLWAQGINLGLEIRY